MGSSEHFLEIMAADPGVEQGVSFARFMELAMYHPTAGYYTRDFRRVGRDRKADFYTATSFNPVFGELVVAAVGKLLAPSRPADFHFVEIGAEPGGGVLRDIPHGFASYRTIRLGEPLAVDGPVVVFSNELFDAQPFHRVVWRNGAWRELGVALRDGRLVEVELADFCPELASEHTRLPKASVEGYHLDLPLRTIPLLQRIVNQPWTGLFLAFDYGRTWHELAEEMPTGTARTYFRQKMGDDLLNRPGEQDLTCHICWDWLEDGLAQASFNESVVESQESFFARHASEALAAMTTAEAKGLSPRKRMLMHLLHPGHMGQKFQAIHALRR
jgi:SAM-dependent MidA family methyltransferase